MEQQSGDQSIITNSEGEKGVQTYNRINGVTTIGTKWPSGKTEVVTEEKGNAFLRITPGRQADYQPKKSVIPVQQFQSDYLKDITTNASNTDVHPKTLMPFAPKTNPLPEESNAMKPLLPELVAKNHGYSAMEELPPKGMPEKSLQIKSLEFFGGSKIGNVAGDVLSFGSGAGKSMFAVVKDVMPYPSFERKSNDEFGIHIPLSNTAIGLWELGKNPDILLQEASSDPFSFAGSTVGMIVLPNAIDLGVAGFNKAVEFKDSYFFNKKLDAMNKADTMGSFINMPKFNPDFNPSYKGQLDLSGMNLVKDEDIVFPEKDVVSLDAEQVSREAKSQTYLKINKFEELKGNAPFNKNMVSGQTNIFGGKPKDFNSLMAGSKKDNVMNVQQLLGTKKGSGFDYNYGSIIPKNGVEGLNIRGMSYDLFESNSPINARPSEFRINSLGKTVKNNMEVVNYDFKDSGLGKGNQFTLFGKRFFSDRSTEVDYFEKINLANSKDINLETLEFKGFDIKKSYTNAYGFKVDELGFSGKNIISAKPEVTLDFGMKNTDFGLKQSGLFGNEVNVNKLLKPNKELGQKIVFRKSYPDSGGGGGIEVFRQDLSGGGSSGGDDLFIKMNLDQKNSLDLSSGEGEFFNRFEGKEMPSRFKKKIVPIFNDEEIISGNGLPKDFLSPKSPIRFSTNFDIRNNLGVNLKNNLNLNNRLNLNNKNMLNSNLNIDSNIVNKLKIDTSTIQDTQLDTDTIIGSLQISSLISQDVISQKVFKNPVPNLPVEDLIEVLTYSKSKRNNIKRFNLSGDAVVFPKRKKAKRGFGRIRFKNFYTPSLSALYFGIRGKPSKLQTGMGGFRPIPLMKGD